MVSEKVGSTENVWANLRSNPSRPGLDLPSTAMQAEGRKATANQQRLTKTPPCLAAAAPEACDSLAKLEPHRADIESPQICLWWPITASAVQK